MIKLSKVNVDALYEYLIQEVLNSDLIKIDESVYVDITTYFRQTRNNGNDSNTINGILSIEERSLIISMIRRLLETRFRKIFLNPSGKLSLSNLTPEETLLFENYKKFRLSMDRLLKNIEMGNVTVLNEMKKKISKRAVLVKIQSDIPPFMGVDLQKYGPLEPEDVTVLPYSNIEPFLNKLYVSEGWVDLS